ncbi:lysosomal alpha-mannosidase-like [Amblyomma americanum]
MTTHYTATVDEMSLGLRLASASGRARVAWQIDPLGHARQEAALFAQMGFDGLFLGRIHLDDKDWRQHNKQMEFLWKADKYIASEREPRARLLLACYLKALHDSGVWRPEFSDDFFPYADQEHAYWTGYYTSRPNFFKCFARRANGILQTYSRAPSRFCAASSLLQCASHVLSPSLPEKACKQLKVIGQLDDSADVDTLGRVNKAYRRLLLSSSGGTAFQQDICLTFCPLLNISSCEITETADEFFVFVYNPLSTPRPAGKFALTLCRKMTHILVKWKDENKWDVYPVKMIGDAPVGIRLLTQENAISELRGQEVRVRWEEGQDAAPAELLAFDAYKMVKRLKGMMAKFEKSPGPCTPADKKCRLFVDPVTGLLSRVMLLNTGLEVPFRQSLFAYIANEGVVEKSSGAYSFSPADDQPVDLGRRGPLLQEIHQTFNDWASHVIRLYKDEDLIEFDWVIGPIPFRRNAQRPWTKTIVEPTAYNYYPVFSWIYLSNESHNLQLTVFPDRPQCGSGLREGELELMYDDSFGAEEPLNEIGVDKRGLVARGTHRVFLGSVEDSERILRTMANRMVFGPQFAFYTRDRQLRDIPVPRASGLQYPLPANLHLPTLEHIGNSRAIARLEHLYPGVKDNRLNRPASLSLKADPDDPSSSHSPPRPSMHSESSASTPQPESPS